LNYDYSQAGAYFVTVCTWQRDCLFGEIVNGEMLLNELGRVVEQEWEKTADLRSNVDLDVFAIMPNHFHAIF
jgi:REP element-mobilizing transposase RayT